MNAIDRVNAAGSGSGVLARWVRSAGGLLAILAANAGGAVVERFSLDHATFLGGRGSESVQAVAVGPSGRFWASGFVGNGKLAGVEGAGTGPSYVAEVIPGSGALGGLLRLPRMEVSCLAVDALGNIFVGGAFEGNPDWTEIDSLPSGGRGGLEGMLVKVAPDGRTILRLTRLGGSGRDEVRALVPDGSGGVFVAGNTESDDFPVSRAAQPVRPGGRDGFLLHVPAQGAAPLFSTFLGGALGDEIRAMTRLPSGDLVVAGATGSSDLPALGGAQTVLGGIRDGFLLCVAGDGSRVRWSTLVGGPNWDELNGVTVDSAGRLVAVGSTQSVRLDSAEGNEPLPPERPTGRDVLVVRLSADGQRTELRTAFGGALVEEGLAVAVDPAGRMLVAGVTRSGDFPVRGALVARSTGDNGDLFLTELEGDGSMVRSTFLGSRGEETFGGMAVDSPGRVWLGASTQYVQPGPYLPVAGRPEQGANEGGYDEGYVALLGRTTSAPVNDPRAARIELTFRQGTTVVNLAGAGREPGEPLHRGVAEGGSAWWAWRAPEDGWVTLSTTGSEFPMVVALYEEQPASAVLPVELEPAGSGPESGRFPVRRGVVYQIALAARTPLEAGAAALHVAFSGAANDDFERRKTIGTLPFAERIDLSLVTSEPEESRISNLKVSAGGVADPSAWWSWKAGQSGKYVLRAEGEGEFRPLLQVLKGERLSALSNVASYDSATNSRLAQIIFHAEAGEDYQIRAASRLGESGLAQLSLQPSTAQAHDDFATRVRLPSERGVTGTGDLRLSSSEPGEPGLSGQEFIYGSGLSLWWTWTSPTNALVHLSTAGSHPWNSDGPFDTWLGVFVGETLGALREVAANDDAGAGQVTSSLLFRAEQGQAYQFYVSCVEWEQDAGPVTLTATVVDPPAWAPGSVGFDLEGRLHGRVLGLTGLRYVVEAAQAIGGGASPWVEVGSLVGASEGVDFVAPLLPETPARFYRIVLPSTP